jgi:hypothetical protein
MRRREFISLLGGTALSWPLAARAQEPDRMRRIGVLSSLAETDSEAQVWDVAFRKRLVETLVNPNLKMNGQGRGVRPCPFVVEPACECLKPHTAPWP